jgi:hypothetical protein
MDTARTTPNEYIAANIHVLNQGAALLRQLDDTAYGHPALGSRSAVGVHFRHALDFYSLFFEGLPAGKIDYDARKRDKRTEQDRAYAIERCEDLIVQLRTLGDAEQPLRVKVDVADDPNDADAYSASSIRRELQGLVSHTIHHYALITYLLMVQQIAVPADFGVAPSTLDYWQRTQLGA